MSSPYPLDLGGEGSPPKFRGWSSKNTVKQGVSGVNLHPLNLRGMGLQRGSAKRQTLAIFGVPFFFSKKAKVGGSGVVISQQVCATCWLRTEKGSRQLHRHKIHIRDKRHSRAQ